MDEVFWAYESLSRQQRKAYDELHYWHRVDNNRVYGIYKTNRYVAMFTSENSQCFPLSLTSSTLAEIFSPTLYHGIILTSSR
jgi:hypothetical protein